jgi:hypothetical protein
MEMPSLVEPVKATTWRWLCFVGLQPPIRTESKSKTLYKTGMRRSLRESCECVRRSGRKKSG